MENTIDAFKPAITYVLDKHKIKMDEEDLEMVRFTEDLCNSMFSCLPSEMTDTHKGILTLALNTVVSGTIAEISEKHNLPNKVGYEIASRYSEIALGDSSLKN